MGKSGADLEYERMLREAGISQASAQGYDAARLEQMIDSAGELVLDPQLPQRLQQADLDARYKNVGELVDDTELPGRLRQYASSATVTDLNAVRTTGLYYVFDTAANAPSATYASLQVLALDAGSCAQIWRAYNSSDVYYRRYSGAWSAWERIFGTAAELDARYGQQYTLPPSVAGAPRWVRIATINGVAINDGAGISLLISGHGDIANTNRSTHLVHLSERADAANCEIWSFGSTDANIPTPTFKYRRTSAYVFELWMQRNSYDGQVGVTVLSSKGSINGSTVINLDSITAVDPGGTVVTPLEIGNDSGWQAPALLNGWVNYGGVEPTAAYRKIGNIVRCRGLIKSGVVPSVAFTLPAGYRPITTIRVPVFSNNAFGSLQIDTNGNVTPVNGSNVSVSLDGIFFLVD